MLKKIIKLAIMCRRLRKVLTYGKDVWVGSNFKAQGNVKMGSHINIGRDAQFISTNATIYIHDYVVMGPEVSIYSGDHAIDILGKHIIEIGDQEKKANIKGEKKYDQDVVIESGCWIGTRVIILKGVTVGKGSVIGAGSVVTKNVPPYSIYVGVPQQKIIRRFSDDEIERHERILFERGKPIY